MIINGDNQVGVKSFLKNISNLWPAEITVIKKESGELQGNIGSEIDIGVMEPSQSLFSENPDKEN